MDIDNGSKVWMNGRFKDWEECQIHIMSHVVHYGSSVFEGIRCYQSKNNSVIFRLKEHMDRLVESAKIYRMDLNLSSDELCQICIDLIKVNEMKDCYIRPIVFRGFGAFGVVPFNSPVEIALACWGWGRYLGEEGLEKGIDVCVSSWNRAAPNTFPTMAKAGGNYLNSQLIKMEAIQNGYAEGIALDSNNYLSEGSGENLFLVKNGKLYTPMQSSNILPGITRDTVITFAKSFGLEVIEASLLRESLYTADELFFTGTAAEITPIRSVDKIPVGEGKRGPITKRIQDAFFGLIKEGGPDDNNWLTPVYD